ncbi:thylakoid lumenal 17.9 kDa protein [Striga asiatica]|uniref:Thylakoid lumenal 17.9 kDa protein n=1 Tax=Striga asiatica TaxID=4170 RepID=A0A5A7Q2Z7_STRAF|nr:thylakoid lumenal 17.9 kDa protein [Striga asiatica]
MASGHLRLHISSANSPLLLSLPLKRCTIACTLNTHDYDTNPKSKSKYWSKNLISLAVAVALVTPLPCSAIPSLNSQSFSNTPFSQSQNLPTGLENGVGSLYRVVPLNYQNSIFLSLHYLGLPWGLGLTPIHTRVRMVKLIFLEMNEKVNIQRKIRACPSINPSCVSSNPKSSNFAFPWRITGYSSESVAIQELQDALLKTLKNVKIQPVEDTPNGKYLKAEVDVGFGRDVLEFLVNGDVVSFRAMATKVTYVYPFTTAFGDSKGEEDRLKKIVNELGWYAPSFDSMD